MLLGESGTGKEVLAHGLHQASPRRKSGSSSPSTARRFPRTCSKANCSATRRAPSPVRPRRPLGKIETANGGTLMLDEIGDLPLSLQAKLLRFLQERSIERVGGRQEIPVDVRIVCATHQDLTALTKDGRFREDLYYRLAEIVIDIPPLRERVGDAALLAHAFVRRFAQEQNRGSLSLSEDAVRAIEAQRLAGQCARAGQLHQARRDHGRRQPDRL